MLHKKIKKVILIAIIILGISSLIDGIANNFNSQKWLYISIFSKDQIIKNELIIHKKTPNAGRGGTNLYYYFGVLKKGGGSARIFGDENTIEKYITLDGSFPVWTTPITTSVFKRKNNIPPKFYQFIHAIIIIFVWLLWIPSLVCLIKNKKRFFK
ncbi:hypothetical protein [Cellulophaga fucicola]|uniref:Uncharacterized protein n=1 Tax=Cellulophaga fucicola TaxID=76595 RepID=A0A1K1QTR6_9FLAO|nr:hypothetical protein [Cellulophaga fucicola]SFW63092.1 hypothetical protein SAMN05660313_02926 [Cellulophaga fucicola]